MAIRSFTRATSAQASVLFVYCTCLFLIGLCQIALGIALRLVYNLQLHIYCYPDWNGALVKQSNLLYALCVWVYQISIFQDFSAIFDGHFVLYFQEEVSGWYKKSSSFLKFLFWFLSFIKACVNQHHIVYKFYWRDSLHWCIIDRNTFVWSDSVQNLWN